jgi:hypothetical protein
MADARFATRRSTASFTRQQPSSQQDEVEPMRRNPPTEGGVTSRWPQPMLIWGTVTLLVALVMALVIVVSGLALEPPDPAPPPKPPMQISPPGGHRMAE